MWNSYFKLNFEKSSNQTKTLKKGRLMLYKAEKDSHLYGVWILRY